MNLPPDRLWSAEITNERRYWEAQFVRARQFMQRRCELDSVLIEIAAQHPLVNGHEPGEEFTARLDLGHELFERFRRDATRVEIYVPGSRHVHEGIADKISLSSAGTMYLLSLGVPAHAIHGDDLNLAYKGVAGVYGSADECFVAASYFKDEDFGRLISVVSPAQLLRKTLHYAAFGVLPLSYTAPTEVMFHDYVEEVFNKIPYVLLKDHDLQSPDSEAANVLRGERKPEQ
jgi:hypothetical protein